MSFLKPDPPQPPSPQATAAAQTSTNVNTSVANAYLNNMNQVTPQGTLSYTQTGSHQWTDPSTGQTYTIPTFTTTQTQSPQEQAIYEQNAASRYAMAGFGNYQAQRLPGLLGDFNPGEGAPAGGSATNISNIPQAATSFNSGGPIQSSIGGYGPIQNTFDPGGQQQQSFNTAGQQQTSYDPAGHQQTSFDNTGLANASNITDRYGGSDNFSADRDKMQEALMARINPQLQIQQDQLRQQLADQGIRYGSQAYNNAFQTYPHPANDARFSAIAQAGSEQQRMNQMAAQAAAFQNSAQQQAYGQAQGRGQFANTAQQNQYQQNQALGQFTNAAQQQQFAQNQAVGQFANQAQQNQYNQNQGLGEFANQAQVTAYQQALGAGTFANQAQGQQFSQNANEATFGNAGLAQQTAQQQAAFNAAQAARNQYMQEQYSNRNQPINEITALMSGGQVSAPSWLNTPSSQIPTTDIAGLINNQFNQQNSIYGQQNANYQSTMGGLLGLGAGAMKLSDRDEKDDIDRIATVFAADSESGERKKLPIYEYSYKDDPVSTRHIGPMAQDVEKVNRQAVVNKDGKKFIRPALVMGSILKAA